MDNLVKKSMNRRSFLAGAAIAGSGVLALGSMGCSSPVVSSEKESSEQEAEVALEYANEETFDVVVVGAGMAGLCAAIRSAEQGMNTVLLERNSTVGGTSAMTEGAFAVGTEMQREIGNTLTVEEAVQSIEEYCHWTNNEGVTRRFVSRSGEVHNWMQEQGVEFDGILTLSDPKVQTWHIYKGYGAQAVETLYGKAQEIGVEVRLDTTGKQLVLNDDGSVSGVVAEDKNGNTFFKAPVAIMCGGGFGNNPDMMREYTYDDPDRWLNVGADGRYGEGIKMGLSAGAALHRPCAVMEAEGFVKGIADFASPVYASTAGAPGLWVNERCQRFCNEHNTAPNFTYYGSVNSCQNATYVIADTNWMEYNKEHGSFFTTSVYLLQGEPIDTLFEELEEAVNNDAIGAYKADTIEGIAEALGLDPQALSDSVSRYNEMCEKGVDEDFGKDPSALIPMNKAPWYGFEIVPTYYTTVGGLKVDEDCCVVRTDGAIIKGLYACGSDAGGVYGYTYDVGAAAGSQQGWAATSGVIAADHAKATFFAQA